MQISDYLAKCPESALAHGYAAIVDRLLYRSSEFHASQARRLNENGPGVESLFVKALTDFSEGRLKETETALREYLAAVPDDRYAMHVLGFTLIDQGLPAKGKEVLQRLLEVHPDYYQATNHLAYATMQTGDEADALRIVDQFVAADPDNPSA